MKASKPTILFLANREESFSRQVLRGIVSMRSEGCDWEIWVMPLIHEKRQLEACLRARNVAGVIARGLGAELQMFFHEQGIPLVAIRGAETSGDCIFNGPHVDDEEIGAKAGKEFRNLNLGYWGFVHWEGVAWSEARRDSFQAYADAHGAKNHVLTLASDEWHSWDGVLKIVEWIQSLSKPCGVLACNDEAGLDVLHACRLGDLNVPAQVAVIGVDNDRLLCESSVPPLSSIDLHAVDVGKFSVKQLRSLLAGESDEEICMSQSSMVVRESSHEIDRYLRTYQKALDFIAPRALTGTSVTAVASGCGVSKRGLERAFEKYSSDSPASFIREQRISAILKLLKNQSITLEHLATQAGFSDASGFSNFVKRMTGKTAGEFR